MFSNLHSVLYVTEPYAVYKLKKLVYNVEYIVFLTFLDRNHPFEILKKHVTAVQFLKWMCVRIHLLQLEILKLFIKSQLLLWYHCEQIIVSQTVDEFYSYPQ